MKNHFVLTVFGGLALSLVSACGSSSSGTGGTAGASGVGDASVVDGGGTADSSAGSGGSSGGAGGVGGSSVGCGNATCGSLEDCSAVTVTGTKLCVSKSVTISAADASNYAIDATETTYAQYQAWLATNPPCPPTTPNDVCSWKTSYNSGVGTANEPVGAVDWCDAYAYCTGLGKRLCGKIGGGANAFDDFADATKSQWHNACTSGAAAGNTYPYGNTYGPNTCNGNDYWTAKDAGDSGTTLPVGTLTACTSLVSGYTGVVDLSGNVWEWEDSCNGTNGQNDDCRLRGGSFLSASTDLQCGSATGHDFRHHNTDNLGFRCCGK